MAHPTHETDRPATRASTTDRESAAFAAALRRARGVASREAEHTLDRVAERVAAALGGDADTPRAQAASGAVLRLTGRETGGPPSRPAVVVRGASMRTPDRAPA